VEVAARPSGLRRYYAFLSSFRAIPAVQTAGFLFLNNSIDFSAVPDRLSGKLKA